MRRIGLAAVLAVAAAGPVAADEPTLFWNLTSGAVVSLRLAHAGQDAYGDNIVAGAADGVEHNGRVNIATLPSGRYDLALRYKDGRLCLVRHVKVETGKTFSVEDKDLKVCNKK